MALPRKTAALDYKTNFSRKWRSSDRTIRRLEDAGFIVFPVGRSQRTKTKRDFKSKIPREVTLIAHPPIGEDDMIARVVIVQAGKKLSESRRKVIHHFAATVWAFNVEVWTWPPLSREPLIERI